MISRRRFPASLHFNDFSNFMMLLLLLDFIIFTLYENRFYGDEGGDFEALPSVLPFFYSRSILS
jgi:hypothetical protein